MGAVLNKKLFQMQTFIQQKKNIILTSKLVFKSLPLHFLTFLTGEKQDFLKKCPQLHFNGKKVQILPLDIIFSSGFTSLFSLIMPILIKAKTTQHDEVTDYKHSSSDLRYKKSIPVQSYACYLKKYKVIY